MITTVERIDAGKACEMMKSDVKPLLVCGYEDEKKFEEHRVEGAISMHEFLSRKDSLKKDQPIIFYCACTHDETAIEQATKFHDEGFSNVKVLEGGEKAWKEAGASSSCSMKKSCCS